MRCPVRPRQPMEKVMAMVAIDPDSPLKPDELNLVRTLGNKTVACSKRGLRGSLVDRGVMYYSS